MAERNAAFLSRRDLFRKSGAFAVTLGFEPYLKYMFPSEPPTTPLPPPSPKPTPDNPAPVENIAPNPRFLEYGSRDTKNIALTFDGCMTQGMLRRVSPDNWHNDRVIQILNKFQIPAHFLLCGLHAEAEPDFTRMLAANPLFTLGNHSKDHKTWTTSAACYGLEPVRSDTEKIAEIQETQEILKRIAGVVPNTFRFPGNCYTAHDIDLVYNLGLTTISIEVIGDDGFNYDPNKIIKKILRETQNGSIIGLHILGRPNAPMTDVALESVIPGLLDRGFNFISIPQLANLH